MVLTLFNDLGRFVRTALAAAVVAPVVVLAAHFLLVNSHLNSIKSNPPSSEKPIPVRPTKPIESGNSILTSELLVEDVNSLFFEEIAKVLSRDFPASGPASGVVPRNSGEVFHQWLKEEPRLLLPVQNNVLRVGSVESGLRFQLAKGADIQVALDGRIWNIDRIAGVPVIVVRHGPTTWSVYTNVRSAVAKESTVRQGELIGQFASFDEAAKKAMEFYFVNGDEKVKFDRILKNADGVKFVGISWSPGFVPHQPAPTPQ